MKLLMSFLVYCVIYYYHFLLYTFWHGYVCNCKHGLIFLVLPFSNCQLTFGLNLISQAYFWTLFFFFSGTLQINCSKDIKIQGIIGPCTSLEKVSFCLLDDCIFGAWVILTRILWVDFIIEWLSERTYCCWYYHRWGKYNWMEDVRPWQEYLLDSFLWFVIKWSVKYTRNCKSTVVFAVSYKVKMKIVF